MLLAEYIPSRQVAEIIGEEFNHRISHNAILKFAKQDKWRKVIAYIRAQMLNKLARVPGYHKAIRLMRYEKIYQEAMTETLTSISQYGKVYELNLAAALKALDSIREEVEGKKGQVVLGDNNKLFFGDINIKEITYEKAVGEVNKRLLSQWD